MRVLGGQTVVDSEHLHAGLAAEHAARRVVRFEIAKDKPATMKKHDEWRTAAGCWGTAAGCWGTAAGSWRVMPSKKMLAQS